MNINKTYLIIGGASAASLIAGAAGGYFAAKRRFNNELPSIIEQETAAVRKHYSIQIEELKKKPASPADIPRQETKVAETKNSSRVPVASQYHNLAKPYQGTNGGRPETAAARAGRLAREEAAAKGEPAPDLKPVVTDEKHNIWDEREGADPETLTLRGPNGRFVSPKDALKNTSIYDTPSPTPISAEDFLIGDRGFEQKHLVWHVENKMLIDDEDDAVVEDLEIVGGEGILSLLDDAPEDDRGDKLIFVRNEGEGIDYQIKLSYMDLADIMAGTETEE